LTRGKGPLSICWRRAVGRAVFPGRPFQPAVLLRLRAHHHCLGGWLPRSGIDNPLEGLDLNASTDCCFLMAWALVLLAWPHFVAALHGYHHRSLTGNFPGNRHALENLDDSPACCTPVVRLAKQAASYSAVAVGRFAFLSRFRLSDMYWRSKGLRNPRVLKLACSCS